MIVDALNVIKEGASAEDLKNWIIEDEQWKIPLIFETARDIKDYLAFKNAIDIGLTIGFKEISFEKAMIYPWIKEVLDGRKN